LRRARGHGKTTPHPHRRNPGPDQHRTAATACATPTSWTDTRFDHADLREADLGGLKLANAKLFAGATISPLQAAELVRALGLSVA
jgi:hypothetical protein